MASLKVGSKVWVFDENRRVYRKKEDGTSRGGPIYREHYDPQEIVEENRASWILRDGKKVSKKDLSYAHWAGGRRTILTDESEIDDACYLHENRHIISDRVLRCNNVAVLRQIEKLLCE